MLEKFKTLLLLVLIGSSLFLTYQLWYGHKPTELAVEDVYEQVDAEKPRPIKDAITPDKIVVNQNDDYYLLRKDEVLFDRYWRYLSDLLSALENNFSSGEPPEQEEEVIACLKCYFDPILPTGDEMPWLNGVAGEKLDILKIYCYEDEVWLVINQPGADGAKHLFLDQAESRQIKNFINYAIINHEKTYSLLTSELANEKIGLDIDVHPSIYVPQDEVIMKSLLLKQEVLDEELLLKTFFVDYNLARVIEERDGGLLYTDGEKGLRLTDYSFEYSYPRLEEGSTSATYEEALRSSISFVNNHGGWPDNLRLESIELQSRRGEFFYNAEWKMYYDGYPILTAQPTKASFNDLGLFHFSRMLFKPEDDPDFANSDSSSVENIYQVSITDWNEAVMKAIDQFDDYLMISGASVRLGKVDLGYVALGSEGLPRAVPVWIISINGETIMLKADDLETIRKEDLF